MKHHPLIPVLLIIAILPLSGCSNHNQTSITKQETTKTDQNTEQNKEPTTVSKDKNHSAQSKNPDSNKNQVTIQTWNERNCLKYSSEKDLIYQLNIREPEVIIPDNLQVQYRINNSLREFDFTQGDYYSFTADAEDYYTSCQENNCKNSFVTYIQKEDYTVLKNDGRILSLEQVFANYNGQFHVQSHSFFDSYDVSTGQKITLDSLSDNPKQLELTLRQNTANQASKEFKDQSFAKNIMSENIVNFVLLSDGLEIYYNESELDDCYTYGKHKFLIPYDKINNQLNAYGKEITSYAQKHNDEPKVKKTTPDYIFPKSNTAYLTGEDLLLLDKDTLRLARNEIYARHGRKFNSIDLELYFKEKHWYTPTTDSNSFDDAILNEYEKKNLTLIETAEKQIKAKEITDGFVTLNPDRTYLLDLDGDGNCESISWTANPIDSMYSTLTLTINGIKQTCTPKGQEYGFKIRALDLKKGDGEIELFIEVPIDSAIGSSNFYRYHNGKLEPIANIIGEISNGAGFLSRYNGLKSKGDGILTVNADSPINNLQYSQFGCYYTDLFYSYSNGKLEEIPQDIYPKKDYSNIISAFNHDDEQNENDYLVSNTFFAMTEKAGDTLAFKATPGETVCPVAWSLKGDTVYVLVMNEAGTCGWVKNNTSYDSDHNYYENVPVWG